MIVFLFFFFSLPEGFEFRFWREHSETGKSLPASSVFRNLPVLTGRDAEKEKTFTFFVFETGKLDEW